MKKRTKFDPNEIIEYDDYAEIVLYDKNCEEKARTLIDLEDVDKVKGYKWCLKNSGHVHNHDIHLHRLIMDCPDDMVVDHINHNTLDNRKSNLRRWTQRQNMMNKKCTGVSWDNKSKKWRARITYKNKQIHLGMFDNKEEALEARRQAEIDLFGKYRYKDED